MKNKYEDLDNDDDHGGDNDAHAHNFHDFHDFHGDVTDVHFTPKLVQKNLL